MTLKERIAEVYPERISDKWEGGVCGCPINYDFLNINDFCCEESNVKCKECWNREWDSGSKCPICNYKLNNCQCRFGGSSHSDRSKREKVVIDHLYLFSEEVIKHIIELERFWKISYTDESLDDIRNEIENEYDNN